MKYYTPKGGSNLILYWVPWYPQIKCYSLDFLVVGLGKVIFFREQNLRKTRNDFSCIAGTIVSILDTAFKFPRPRLQLLHIWNGAFVAVPRARALFMMSRFCAWLLQRSCLSNLKHKPLCMYLKAASFCWSWSFALDPLPHPTPNFTMVRTFL